MTPFCAYVGDIKSHFQRSEGTVADTSSLGHIDLLINNAGQPSFKVPTAYEAADVDKCLKGLKGMILWTVETLKACGEQNALIAPGYEHRRHTRQTRTKVYCATSGVRKGCQEPAGRMGAPVSRWSPSIRAALIPLSTVTVATTSPRPSSTPSCSPARLAEVIPLQPDPRGPTSPVTDFKGPTATAEPASLRFQRLGTYLVPKAFRVGERMHISDDEFERAIEQVLDDLPERFARVLENVGIVVADEPNERANWLYNEQSVR